MTDDRFRKNRFCKRQTSIATFLPLILKDWTSVMSPAMSHNAMPFQNSETFQWFFTEAPSISAVFSSIILLQAENRPYPSCHATAAAIPPPFSLLPQLQVILRPSSDSSTKYQSIYFPCYDPTIGTQDDKSFVTTTSKIRTTTNTNSKRANLPPLPAPLHEVPTLPLLTVSFPPHRKRFSPAYKKSIASDPAIH
jgi:hypothetical protein